MMEHLVDILSVAVIILIAGGYLWRTFRKARKNCGSICSGCSGSCQTKVKQFGQPQAIKFQPLRK